MDRARNFTLMLEDLHNNLKLYPQCLNKIFEWALKSDGIKADRGAVAYLELLYKYALDYPKLLPYVYKHILDVEFHMSNIARGVIDRLFVTSLSSTINNALEDYVQGLHREIFKSKLPLKFTKNTMFFHGVVYMGEPGEYVMSGQCPQFMPALS